MSDNQDSKQLLLQQLDLETVGRRIAEGLVEVLSKPETLTLIEGFRYLARNAGRGELLDRINRDD